MELAWSRPQRSFGFLDALGVMGALGLLVARFVPVARLPFWRCELRALTGWPCLGCGLTRAADHLAHGNVASAFLSNPIGAVAGILFALAALYALLHALVPLPAPEVRVSDSAARRLRWMFGLAVLLNWGFVIVQTRFPHVLHG